MEDGPPLTNTLVLALALAFALTLTLTLTLALTLILILTPTPLSAGAVEELEVRWNRERREREREHYAEWGRTQQDTLRKWRMADERDGERRREEEEFRNLRLMQDQVGLFFK